MADLNEFARVLAQMEEAHLAIHMMPPDDAESDTMLVALTERELLMVGLALPVMQLAWPCLGGDSQVFQHRLLDLVRVQRPEWTTGGQPPTEGRSE